MDEQGRIPRRAERSILGGGHWVVLVDPVSSNVWFVYPNSGVNSGVANKVSCVFASGTVGGVVDGLDWGYECVTSKVQTAVGDVAK